MLVSPFSYFPYLYNNRWYAQNLHKQSTFFPISLSLCFFLSFSLMSPIVSTPSLYFFLLSSLFLWFYSIFLHLFSCSPPSVSFFIPPLLIFLCNLFLHILHPASSFSFIFLLLVTPLTIYIVLISLNCSLSLTSIASSLPPLLYL